ncbi:unnamed protein product [Ceutorhynchus assimilis]|uniref:Uncharacterized protein n=1 Tax=Ceutorhynchus assimilis TaxID=467358 RepID=A0A9N9QNL8_9CUCU|nr:unnamed protein product [Ceutorhynchus assimilis]
MEQQNSEKFDLILSKIREFTDLLNSQYGLALLHCPESDRESFTSTLLSLEKSVHRTLKYLGTSLSTRKYHFSCGVCNENILIQPGKDIWTSLQDHEHFEEMYSKLLSDELEIVPENATSMPNQSESESTSNTDSGIEHQENEQTKIQNYPPTTPENANVFRFNFTLRYNDEVENKLYPSNMMQSIRKYDKVQDFSIMRAGNTRAVCFLCPCEMNSKRVTKVSLMNHAMGQRHMNSATTPTVIENLRCFHDFWLRQEPPVQAHQVYFRCFECKVFRCTLCYVLVNCEDVLVHLKKNSHKNRVLDFYHQRSNTFFLVNLQVQVYGVTKEEIEVRESEIRANEEERIKEKQAKKNLDSETVDEAKNMSKNPTQELVHNIIKSVENSGSSDPLKLLPNRMKEEAKCLKRVTKNKVTVIECQLCKCDIPDNKVLLLKKHIATSPLHQKKNYKYFCEICSSRANSEELWMRHDFGANRHVKMAESRKNRVTEYECTTCQTVIFGDELSLTRHLSVGKDRKKGLPDPVKTLFTSKQQIEEQAIALANEAEGVINNSLTRDCCEKLETDLKLAFEHCKVYPFGSRISGIGNDKSDLDVFVDVGGAYYGKTNQDPFEQVRLIRAAVKVFKQTEYNHIGQVLTARTPILRLHHKSTNLDCDLSFKHGLSVENTKFLRFCIQLQPVSQQLMLLVKKWTTSIYFENVTTYSSAILCIFYLQVNGYLLSVEKLREINKAEHPTIAGWRTINYTLPIDEVKKHIKLYNKPILELLIDFFKYYSKFDFNSFVICPLLAQLVKRSVFSEGSPQDLPKEMDAYVTQLAYEDAEIFRSNSYMCIQDPFDLSHNLTKAAQQGTIIKFQKMCKHTLEHLKNLQ